MAQTAIVAGAGNLDGLAIVQVNRAASAEQFDSGAYGENPAPAEGNQDFVVPNFDSSDDRVLEVAHARGVKDGVHACVGLKVLDRPVSESDRQERRGVHERGQVFAGNRPAGADVEAELARERLGYEGRGQGGRQETSERQPFVGCHCRLRCSQRAAGFRQSTIRERVGPMKTYTFRVIVEPDGDRWHAHCPALEQYGAATWGVTQEEVLKHIQEVVQMVVEELQEDAVPIPDTPRQDVEVSEEPRISVTIPSLANR